jgi:multisubunit Na+/H+ antiporter MnhC subunit
MLIGIALLACGALGGAAIMIAGVGGVLVVLLATLLICKRPDRAIRLGLFGTGLAWTLASISASVVIRMPACGSSAGGSQCYADVTLPLMIAAIVIGLGTAVSVGMGVRKGPQ